MWYVAAFCAGGVVGFVIAGLVLLYLLNWQIKLGTTI